MSPKTMCVVIPPFSPKLCPEVRAEGSGALSLPEAADVLCIFLISHIMFVKHSFTPSSRDSEHVQIHIFPDGNIHSQCIMDCTHQYSQDTLLL